MMNNTVIKPMAIDGLSYEERKTTYNTGLCSTCGEPGGPWHVIPGFRCYIDIFFTCKKCFYKKRIKNLSIKRYNYHIKAKIDALKHEVKELPRSNIYRTAGSGYDYEYRISEWGEEYLPFLSFVSAISGYDLQEKDILKRRKKEKLINILRRKLKN